MSGSGAVYVFTRSGSDWLQETYLKASNTDAGDQFGSAVALSRDGATLAVGATQEASGSTGIDGAQEDNSKPYSGAVYVFICSGGAWSQQSYIKAAVIVGGQSRFGSQVALSADGNTLAVGAPHDAAYPRRPDVANFSAGSVSMFVRSGSAWSQQAYVRGSNTDGSDYFGESVALSADGNVLAVGAWGQYSGEPTSRHTDGENPPWRTGAVYAFVRNGSTWSEQGYIKASNPEAFDEFGYDVALNGDGNTLAVGAVYEASNATGVSGTQADESMHLAGAVYVY
jgi:hypothetical protein